MQNNQKNEMERYYYTKQISEEQTTIGESEVKSHLKPEPSQLYIYI